MTVQIPSDSPNQSRATWRPNPHCTLKMQLMMIWLFTHTRRRHRRRRRWCRSIAYTSGANPRATVCCHLDRHRLSILVLVVVAATTTGINSANNQLISFSRHKYTTLSGCTLTGARAHTDTCVWRGANRDFSWDSAGWIVWGVTDLGNAREMGWKCEFRLTLGVKLLLSIDGAGQFLNEVFFCNLRSSTEVWGVIRHVKLCSQSSQDSHRWTRIKSGVYKFCQ